MGAIMLNKRFAAILAMCAAAGLSPSFDAQATAIGYASNQISNFIITFVLHTAAGCVGKCRVATMQLQSYNAIVRNTVFAQATCAT